MQKLEKDLLLGALGGAAVASAFTWMLTYGVMTQWRDGSCDSGWLELSGIVVGLLGVGLAALTPFYFERRARRIAAGQTVTQGLGLAAALVNAASSFFGRRGGRG